MIKTMFLLLLFSSLGRASTKCGRSLPCERGFVVGGTDTCIREFPWHVSLVKLSPIPGQQLRPFCGASIISRKFLVSAAHCFFYSKDDPEPNVRKIRAYPDFDDRSVRLLPYLRVKRIELHEDWLEHPSKWRRGNDIALLHLRDPVHFSGVVSPICLPNVDQGYLIEEGRSVKMAGFGRITEFIDKFSIRLQKGDFQVINCGEKNNNICADEVKNGNIISSTCHGDSGGGLVGRENESFYLVGIVSWGRQCGAVNFTTRYTSLFRHLDWINQRICLTENDNVCILPFTYGENHTECIIANDNTAATCPTTLDAYNEGAAFEFCSDSCPGYKMPVDGSYGQWTAWGQCSRSCGGGKSERNRTCDSPTPKYGGKECTDDAFEEMDCNIQDCPPFFTSEKSEIIPSYSNCTAVGERCYNTKWLRTNGKCPDLVQILDEVLQGDESRANTALEKTCNYDPYGFCCSTADEGITSITTTTTTSTTSTTTPTSSSSTTITTVAGHTILMESSGGAAEYQGGKMGYFDRTQQKLFGRHVYKQRGGDDFLYYFAEDGRWYVGEDTLGEVKGYLYVASEDLVPRTTGWLYYGGGEWQTDDSTLRVSTSPPDPSSSCTTIRVAATGPAARVRSSNMGEYSWEGEWLNGHKIFRGGRDKNKYLRIKTGKSAWSIGSSKDSGGAGISSGRGTSCPCHPDAGPNIRLGRDWWKYSDDGWHVDQSIQVTCV